MHRQAVFDLSCASSEFADQAREYSALADHYGNPLFASSFGRSVLSAAAKLRSGDMKTVLHVVPKRKTPLATQI
jgi:hypothetical protein